MLHIFPRSYKKAIKIYSTHNVGLKIDNGNHLLKAMIYFAQQMRIY